MAASPATRALAGLAAGQSGVVRHTTLNADDEALLEAMGVRRGGVVMVCRVGEPFIVAVLARCSSERPGTTAPGACSCRIGLARSLAERIFVAEPTASAPAPSSETAP
jgi:hypothetical protein